MQEVTSKVGLMLARCSFFASCRDSTGACLSLLKMTHKSLYYEGWPKHLQLEFQRPCSYNCNLRSSDAPRLSVPRETNTFKSMAARSFNSLPDSVRQLTDYHTFAKAAGSICSRNSKHKSFKC